MTPEEIRAMGRLVVLLADTVLALHPRAEQVEELSAAVDALRPLCEEP